MTLIHSHQAIGPRPQSLHAVFRRCPVRSAPPLFCSRSRSGELFRRALNPRGQPRFQPQLRCEAHTPSTRMSETHETHTSWHEIASAPGISASPSLHLASTSLASGSASHQWIPHSTGGHLGTATVQVGAPAVRQRNGCASDRGGKRPAFAARRSSAKRGLHARRPRKQNREPAAPLP